MVQLVHLRYIISTIRTRYWRHPSVWIGLGIMLSIILVPPIQAQETVKTTHAYTFGQTATFSLALSPGTNAPEATLYVTINNERTLSYTTPLENNQAHYQRDLRAQAFPPFANVSYWWQFKDSQDQIQKTNEVTFVYEDNRFRWEQLERGTLTLHWVSGEASLMVNALDIAHAALTEVQNTLQTSTDSPIAIYIYPSLPDLQSALRLAGRRWVGGQAYPEIGVVLMAIAPSNEAILKMKQLIPHELTHKILYDDVGAQGYESLPIWLIEGLASHFEQSPDPTYALALENAAQQEQFIPLQELCFPFPEDRAGALLSYAQSQSVINYLRKTYGWSRIRALIDAYADGLDCSMGMRRAMEIDIGVLDREWQLWYQQEEETLDTSKQNWKMASLVIRDLAPWFMLIAIIFLPAAALFIETRLKPSKQVQTKT